MYKESNEARDKVSILDFVRKRKKQQKQRFLRDGLKKLTLKSANVIKGGPMAHRVKSGERRN
ncbi:unnamed protein product [Brassica oleracea]